MEGIADRRSYGAGDIIFRDGAKGDGFYLIEKGAVEIYKTMPDGKKAASPWHLMTYEFRVKPGEGAAPKPLGTRVTEDA